MILIPFSESFHFRLGILFSLAGTIWHSIMGNWYYGYSHKAGKALPGKRSSTSRHDMLSWMAKISWLMLIFFYGSQMRAD
jgi:hypothetical protein